MKFDKLIYLGAATITITELLAKLHMYRFYYNNHVVPHTLGKRQSAATDDRH